jgi:osmotically-inducible protein OsmY
MATLARLKKTESLHRSISSQGRAYETINVEALNGVVSYLNYLYVEGEISDTAYQALMSQVLSTFVDNSIRLKLERVFRALNLGL